MSHFDARTLPSGPLEDHIRIQPGSARARGQWAVLLMYFALPGGLVGQAGSVELRELATRMDEARAAATHLLAPRTFARAADRLADAARRFEGDGVDDAFRQRIAEARASLTDAERIAATGRERFAETLSVRAAAVVAEAEVRAPESWQKAEAEFEEAGRRFERDNVEDATRRAAQASTLYATAARSAWRDRHLSSALAARAEAVSARAVDFAPETFAEGEGFLATGEEEIANGNTGASAARAGQEAQGAFEQASAVALLADSVRRSTVTVERLILAHEADLRTVAQAAGVETARGVPSETSGRLVNEVQRLKSEISRLTEELGVSREAVQRLEAQVSALEGRLTDSERRFAETRDELLQRRQRERRIQEAQGLFTPEEAEVFLVGDRLVLRLLGLTFESGSADILETHAGLLTKVQRVITTFGGSGVRIEGHTDSSGPATNNQALSQRRAIAIREHLLARIPISSSMVEAIGLGEEQPIAPNETEEGRARNRRTEIVITLPEGGG